VEITTCFLETVLQDSIYQKEKKKVKKKNLKEKHGSLCSRIFQAQIIPLLV
jgi:hypothetical protein